MMRGRILLFGLLSVVSCVGSTNLCALPKSRDTAPLATRSVAPLSCSPVGKQ
jgi:hypothetical protein